MKTDDFNSLLTSKMLNENMFKKYGKHVDFSKYTREQLENYRNVVRTQVHQVETNTGFNELLSNEGYQQDKHLLELLNTKIKELLGESKKRLIKEKALSTAQQKAAGIALAAKRKGEKPAGKGAAAQMSKMSTKELKKFAGTKHKGLPTKMKVKETDDSFSKISKDVRKGSHEIADELSPGYNKKKQPATSRSITSVSKLGKKGKAKQKSLFGDNLKKTNEARKAKHKMTNKTKGKPDYLDFDGDGNKTERMKKALADKKKKKGSPPAKKSIRETVRMPPRGTPLPSKDEILDIARQSRKNRRPASLDRIMADIENVLDNNSNDPHIEKWKRDIDEIINAARKDELPESKKSNKKPMSKGKPDYLDFDRDSNKKETMKKALADKKNAKKGFPPAKKAMKKTVKKKSKLRESDTHSLVHKLNELNTVIARMENLINQAKQPNDTRNFPNDFANETINVFRFFDNYSNLYGPNKAIIDTIKKLRDEAKRLEQTGFSQAHKDFATSTVTPLTNMVNVFKNLQKPGSPWMDEIINASRNEKLSESNKSKLRNRFNIILEGIRYYIAEDEEGKAMDITAGADMVKDFTSWMQRLGQYQTKSTIELADSIRSNFGPQEAEQFKTTVTPAIQSSLEALTASREIITKAVSVLAGEEQAETPMGTPGGEDEEMPSFEPNSDSMNEPEEEEDEFTASDAASGGAETSGREMRENRKFSRLKKLAEQHSIMKRLAG